MNYENKKCLMQFLKLSQKNCFYKNLYLYLKYKETVVQEQTLPGILQSLMEKNTLLEGKTEICLPNRVIMRVKNI